MPIPHTLAAHYRNMPITRVLLYYTGQLPPAPARIQPRRLGLPPTFTQDEEWRRIGARRSEFLHLGMPRFGPPRRIVVKTSPHSLSYLQSSGDPAPVL